MRPLDFIYKPIAKATADYLKAEVAQNLEKSTPVGQAVPNGAMIRRSAFDPHLSDQNTRRKPQTSVSFDTLRRFSVNHEVARICINARKRQISSLGWDIVPVSTEDHNDYSKDIELIKQYFKSIGGYGVRFREFQDTIIEDLLVLDAAVLYKQRNRSGAIEYYMPVDAATIKLRVDEAGNTPRPPEAAYVQYIRGTKVGEYTAEDMIYEMMNPRSDTPYGLAPLESLIMVVTSALKSSLYNLDFLTSGNIPEGLLTLPESWGLKQIQEYMDYFDSLTMGNSSETTKMKPVPGGSTFTETKKRSDMAFKEFNDWLMKITCAMFDIQPQEIGFTDSVNRANGAEQNDITTRRGILPLANLLSEVFDDIIQQDLGFTHLRFNYLGLEDRDMLQDAQAKEVRLRSGIVTIDEVRKEEGLEPLGIDRPYISSSSQFVTPELVNPPKTDPAAGDAGTVEDKPAEDAPDDPVVKADTADAELRRLEKYAVRRLKLGKAYRPFESDILEPSTVADLNTKLAKAGDATAVKSIVGAYMGRGKPRFLAKSGQTDSSDQTDDYEHNPHFDLLLTSAGFAAFAELFRKAIQSQAKWAADNLAAIEAILLDIDAMGVTNAQRGQIITYLSDNMPKIADKVSTERVVDWYKEVSNSAVNSLYSQLGSPVAFNLTNEAALQDLQTRAEALLTKSTLDETTKKKLADLIVKGKDAGLTTKEIQKEITENFTDISKVRAGMIAHTETVNLMNKQQYDAMMRVGVLQKAWINYGSHVCPICLTNADDGFIPMDGLFSSGDLMPSAHIGCECGLDYATQDIALGSLWDGGED